VFLFPTFDHPTMDGFLESSKRLKLGQQLFVQNSFALRVRIASRSAFCGGPEWTSGTRSADRAIKLQLMPDGGTSVADGEMDFPTVCIGGVMAAALQGVKVAILVTDGFEQVELVEPRKALEEAGAQTSIVSPKQGKVRGWKSTDWGDEIPVDQNLDSCDPGRFDALLLPGGVINPDKLRMIPKAVQFVKAFFQSHKPVAAICHGPWTIIEAGEAKGRRIASWPSLQTDLRNAGAEWMNEEAVRDGNLVSSRKPDDLPAFNREVIRLLAELRPKTQHAG
jgi:protease I